MSWNEYSDDSWMDNESESDKQSNTKKQQTTANKSLSRDVSKQQQGPANGQSRASQANKVQNKQKKPYNKALSKKESHKYLTDQEVLQLYENGKVEDPTKIKVINCYQKSEKQMLQQNDSQKKLRIKEFHTNCYVVKCWTKQDLIKFVKQKIEKNFKFKLAIYVPSQKEKQMKAQKQKQRQQRDKEKSQRRARQQQQHKQHRGQKDHKERPKVQYREKNQPRNQQKQQPKGRKQYRKQKDEQDEKRPTKQHGQSHKQRQGRYNKDEQPRDHRDHRIKKQQSKQQERKAKDVDDYRHEKKEKHQKKHHKIETKDIEREGKTSAIQIKTDQVPPSEVVDWIKQHKLPNQFSAIKLVAQGRLFQYVEKICQQAHKLIKFGLTSEICEQQCLQKPDQVFTFIIEQNKQPVPIKKSISGSYIAKPCQEDFDTIDKFNTHIIGNKINLQQDVQFDEKQYIELFKKNYQKIVSKWQSWVLFAYSKNISKLLKLSGSIKKLLPKNTFNYDVGMQNKLPFLHFEICDLHKTKYKVDASVINSHLQDS